MNKKHIVKDKALGKICYSFYNVSCLTLDWWLPITMHSLIHILLNPNYVQGTMLNTKNKAEETTEFISAFGRSQEEWTTRKLK